MLQQQLDVTVYVAGQWRSHLGIPLIHRALWWGPRLIHIMPVHSPLSFVGSLFYFSLNQEAYGAAAHAKVEQMSQRLNSSQSPVSEKKSAYTSIFLARMVDSWDVNPPSSAEMVRIDTATAFAVWRALHRRRTSSRCLLASNTVGLGFTMPRAKLAKIMIRNMCVWLNSTPEAMEEIGYDRPLFLPPSQAIALFVQSRLFSLHSATKPLFPLDDPPATIDIIGERNAHLNIVSRTAVEMIEVGMSAHTCDSRMHAPTSRRFSSNPFHPPNHMVTHLHPELDPAPPSPQLKLGRYQVLLPHMDGEQITAPSVATMLATHFTSDATVSHAPWRRDRLISVQGTVAALVIHQPGVMNAPDRTLVLPIKGPGDIHRGEWQGVVAGQLASLSGTAHSSVDRLATCTSFNLGLPLCVRHVINIPMHDHLIQLNRLGSPSLDRTCQHLSGHLGESLIDQADAAAKWAAANIDWAHLPMPSIFQPGHLPVVFALRVADAGIVSCAVWGIKTAIAHAVEALLRSRIWELTSLDKTDSDDVDWQHVFIPPTHLADKLHAHFMCLQYVFNLAPVQQSKFRNDAALYSDAKCTLCPNMVDSCLHAIAVCPHSEVPYRARLLLALHHVSCATLPINWASAHVSTLSSIKAVVSSLHFVESRRVCFPSSDPLAHLLSDNECSDDDQPPPSLPATAERTAHGCLCYMPQHMAGELPLSPPTAIRAAAVWQLAARATAAAHLSGGLGELEPQTISDKISVLVTHCVAAEYLPSFPSTSVFTMVTTLWPVSCLVQWHPLALPSTALPATCPIPLPCASMFNIHTTLRTMSDSQRRCAWLAISIYTDAATTIDRVNDLLGQCHSVMVCLASRSHIFDLHDVDMLHVAKKAKKLFQPRASGGDTREVMARHGARIAATFPARTFISVPASHAIGARSSRQSLPPPSPLEVCIYVCEREGSSQLPRPWRPTAEMQLAAYHYSLPPMPTKPDDVTVCCCQADTHPASFDTWSILAYSKIDCLRFEWFLRSDRTTSVARHPDDQDLVEHDAAARRRLQHDQTGSTPAEALIKSTEPDLLARGTLPSALTHLLRAYGLPPRVTDATTAMMRCEVQQCVCDYHVQRMSDQAAQEARIGITRALKLGDSQGRDLSSVTPK